MSRTHSNHNHGVVSGSKNKIKHTVVGGEDSALQGLESRAGWHMHCEGASQDQFEPLEVGDGASGGAT